MTRVRIGTRGSQLALAQASEVRARLMVAHGLAEEDFEISVISTSGDRILDRPLSEVGGKGLFTKEIEEALLDGSIDCAIHSMKDVPAVLPDGLCISAIPEREDPRDAFLSHKVDRLEDLPQGAVLGTASLRRQAQSLHRRSDLNVQMLRGNVDTRLAKLAAGDADAILLAMSGLNRLGLGHLPKSLIDPVECPPAPGQGALAIETRISDIGAPWLEAVRHAPTAVAVAAERGALTALEGSCKTAIGAHARLANGGLHLIVEALSADGVHRFRREGSAELSTAQDPLEAARALGLSLGAAVREEGGDLIVVPD